MRISDWSSDVCSSDLSNAVKFTAAGGRVSLWLGTAPDGMLQYTVSDSGIGIAPGDIAKVQTPFGTVESTYARRFGGTGLGLPLAKSPVELQGRSEKRRVGKWCGITGRSRVLP